MTMWQDNLAKLYASIGSRDCDMKQLTHLVEEQTRALGFDYFIYLIKPPQPIHHQVFEAIGNVDAKWLNTFIRKKAYQSDLVVQSCMNNKEIQYWEAKLQARSETDLQIVHSGHCLAQQCADVFCLKGVLCFIREQPLKAECFKNPSWLSQYEQVRRAVHLSFSAHLMRDWRVQKQNSIQTLTPREIEVLSWSADGKSAQEISQILNISIHTVNVHLKNCSSKLQTSNKTASVLKAYLAGLLV